MDAATNWYVILLLGGLFMIGAEIYVPGGVLGVVGGVCLVAAIFVGFYAFPAPYDTLSAIAILILSVVCLYLWIRFFPSTKIGKQLTLSQDATLFKGTEDRSGLMGEQGEAVTPLRPSGIVLINGKRQDVIADGSFLEAGATVRVVEVEGNQVTVRRVNDATA